jgi:glutamine amidotransferase
MKNRILIINYGMGNLLSVSSALIALGGDCFISSSKDDIPSAGAYILPGVGAFFQAMENFEKLDLIEPLSEHVLVKKKPFLGICLGMQMIAEDSVEKGFRKGLGWIRGHVKKIDTNGDFPLPHVGWNSIKIEQRSPLFLNLNEETNFYFDHSYHVSCAADYVSAKSWYGTDIVAAVQYNNILATQFHPEKSQNNGLRLLRNFMNLIEHPNIFLRH